VVEKWPFNEPLAKLEKLAKEGQPADCPSPLDLRRDSREGNLCFIQFSTPDDAIMFLEAHRVNAPCRYGLVREGHIYPLQYSKHNSIKAKNSLDGPPSPRRTPHPWSPSPRRRHRSRSRSPLARVEIPIHAATNTITVYRWSPYESLNDLERLATEGRSCPSPVDVRRERGDGGGLCFIQFESSADATQFLQGHRVVDPDHQFGLVRGEQIYPLSYSRRDSNPASRRQR